MSGNAREMRRTEGRSGLKLARAPSIVSLERQFDAAFDGGGIVSFRDVSRGIAMCERDVLASLVESRLDFELAHVALGEPHQPRQQRDDASAS